MPILEDIVFEGGDRCSPFVCKVYSQTNSVLQWELCNSSTNLPRAVKKMYIAS